MRCERFRQWLAVLGCCLILVGGAVSCGGDGDLTDSDGDGVSPPFDCDDGDASVHPAAPEVPYDGIDQDCDGEDLIDIDRDGYEDVSVDGGSDCDDGDPSINPAADEVPYDGIDQDCDGIEDDGDADEDGHNATSVGGDDCCDLGIENELGCSPLTAASMYPGAEEISYDGIDQDCNGLDYGGVITEGDDDSDGFVNDDIPEGIDCDDTDPEIFPGAVERCNDKDDDCDGTTDEGLIDHDGDGVCSCLDCDDYDPRRSPLIEEVPYDEIDNDCDGSDLTDVDGDGQDSIVVLFGTDCDDLDPEIYPTAPERCNNLDDDCDSDIDEDFTGAYQDADGDTWLACADCDDNNISVYPFAPELSANGIDDDCDTLTDEVDADGDGWFDQAVAPDLPDCCDNGAEGGLGCDALNAPSINPGMEDFPYDNIDQDCDGADLVDPDGDGHLAIEHAGDDCDDGNPDAFPGPHVDACMDPADNNCDGTVNEGCGPAADEDVEVAAGQFLMGRTDEEMVLNPDQQPQHPVDLVLYYIDKYEVTVADYRRCVVDGPCFIDSVPIPSFADEHYWENQERGLNPAVSISWDEARLYCQWVGKDLPTEAQWEKAARGTATPLIDYPWGQIVYAPGPEGFDVRQTVGCDTANHRKLCDRTLCEDDTVPVNRYDTIASPFGTLNQSGNAAEWVRDWYDAGYYQISPVDDPDGPGAGTHKVVRGGSFLDIDYWMEVTARWLTIPTSRDVSLGFRCARLPPNP